MINMGERVIELRLKMLPKITSIDRIVLIWKEQGATEPMRTMKYYNFLLNVTGVEVAFAFKALESLVDNIETNLRVNKPRVTQVITPPHRPFLSEEFALVCQEIGAQHRIE